MKKFIFLALLLTIARYADLQTTYFSTPDLKTEANPLVSKLGFDWTELIISQVIFLGLLIYFLWIYSFRTVRTPIVDAKLPLIKFVSLFYFNDIKGFYRILYKLPTNRNSLLYSLCFILTYTFIIWSFVVSVSTILLLINKSYRSFYISNSLWIYLYFAGLGLFMFFSVKFFKNEFSKRILS